MSRTRASAKRAGARFEQQVVDHLAAELGDDRIERRTMGGSRDRGDIGGVRSLAGKRVVIEVKNVAHPSLSEWVREAETEKGNDDAGVGLVVHKRHGNGVMGEQYVTMTLDNLIELLTP